MMMTLSRTCITPEHRDKHKMPLKQKLIDNNDNEADLSDKGINGLEEIPNISEFSIYLKLKFFKILVIEISHFGRWFTPGFHSSLIWTANCITINGLKIYYLFI
jgi:hypothetical protein